jgi:hypothetical protein
MKKKEIEIIVPTSWKGVTLGKYLDLQKDLENYGETEEGYIACVFHHLCNLDAKYLSQIDTETFSKIKSDLVEFMGKSEFPLQRIITIDGVEYGFEPNLSKMPYGAYLDIVQYDTFKIDENWPKILSILYRPITSKMGEMYDVESYKGKIDEEKFKEVNMEVAFGSLFFFVRLLTHLPNAILNSMMDGEILPPNIKSTLERSGKTIHQLLHSQTVT